MKIPDRPYNEQLRLKNLRSLNILDTDAEERFDRVTRLAKRLFRVPIALVSLVDENRQWFKSGIGINSTQTSRDISFCGHTILGNQPFIIPDASADSRFMDNPLVIGEPNIRFYAGVPLSFEDGTKLGTLCIIDHKPHYISQESLRDLVDLAKIVENELSVTHIATIDELTRISNRRGFILLAQKAITYCHEMEQPYALTYLDLNRFKRINDEFGHLEGDKVLQRFAQLMLDNFREFDICARIGGDEFVVFLSGASQRQAETVIRRFQNAVDEDNQKTERGYHINFSIGVVSAQPSEEKSIESLLSDADQQMYKGKKYILNQ
jgi:diguanylate cyclase (GGDEF)-like protein